MAVELTPPARIRADSHAPGSLIAEIPEDPRAWPAFCGYAVGMLAWPVTCGLSMMPMTSQRRTMIAGAAIGLPLFPLTLLGAATTP